MGELIGFFIRLLIAIALITGAIGGAMLLKLLGYIL